MAAWKLDHKHWILLEEFSLCPLCNGHQQKVSKCGMAQSSLSMGKGLAEKDFTEQDIKLKRSSKIF